MKRFQLKISGQQGEGFVVGRLNTSDYISFSREYFKKDREPIFFTALSLDTTLPNTYGRCFLQTNVDQSLSTTTDSNPLLDQVYTLIQDSYGCNSTDDDITYNSIKSQIVLQFTEEEFDKNKDAIKCILSYPTLTTSIGLCYRTSDGFIKICTTQYFGGLSPDNFVFFLLDMECLGYGEQIQHNSSVRLLYVDQNNRIPWNLEKRFFMGGVGDGVNAAYMCCNSTTSTTQEDHLLVDHFTIHDLDYQKYTSKTIEALNFKVKQLQVLEKNAQELILLLRENNGEAENEVKKEHQQNEFVRSELVRIRMEKEEQKEMYLNEIKLLKSQKKLLKNECRRLQKKEQELQQSMNETLAMRDIDVAEMSTLRKQLNYHTLDLKEVEGTREPSVERCGSIESIGNVGNVGNVAALRTDSSPPLPPREAREENGEAKEVGKKNLSKKSSKGKGFISSKIDQLKKKKNHSDAGEVLNLKSTLSFLTSEVKDLECENLCLKRNQENQDITIKEIGSKLHKLVVENEKLKSALSTSNKTGQTKTCE